MFFTDEVDQDLCYVDSGIYPVVLGQVAFGL